MAIRFECPNCKKVFTTADDTAGKRAKCGKCGTSFVIPADAARVGAKSTSPEPPRDDFDGGATMRPRQPLRAQSLAADGDEFDMGATLAPRRPTAPPLQDDFDHGATMPRAKPDTAGSRAQADTHQDRAGTRTTSDLPLGSEVDARYLIVSKLGQGGMGAVYKVVDKDTQTEFALKVLASDLVGSPEALVDLKKEVAIAQQLTHQNLLRVNYLGCTAQLTYLLMEYIDGEDLETYRLRQGGKVSSDDFRAIVPQLVQGLEYLHNKGIVHLDIKPRNIMVSKAGELKLTDFGVSRSIKEQVSRHNQDQDLAGTLCFMAPEQIRKQVCDRRADIYAMGIVFCQLLTGRFPFAAGDPKAIAAWHLGPDLDPAKLPAEWRELLRRCLARDPAKRFGTCREMLPLVEGSSTESALDDIFGDSTNPAEQHFRRAAAQAFAKGEPTPQQREALRSLMQQLGITPDAAKRIVEEQRTERDAVAKKSKATENLRILLDAGQYRDAAALANTILAADARNALAWAAKAGAASDNAEVLKCFEMAESFAPNDKLVMKERLRQAGVFSENANKQFDWLSRLDFNCDLHNEDGWKFLRSAGAAVRLAPELEGDVMRMVTEACTEAIERHGWYFNADALADIFGASVFSRFFLRAADRPALAEPRIGANELSVPNSDVYSLDPRYSGSDGGERREIKPRSKGVATLHFVCSDCGLLVSFKVHVDGSLVAKLGSGEQCSVNVAAGNHVLKVSGGGAFFGAEERFSVASHDEIAWQIGYKWNGGVALQRC